jgi:predicted dehydrogenase
MKSGFNRRRFLGAAGGVAAALLTTRLRASANNRMNCAVLGVGGRGTGLLSLALTIPDVRVAAVCDIKPDRLANGLDMVTKAGQPPAAGFGDRGPLDYRRMLESKDIDAVIIATPMQDHAPMAIDCLKAGKAVLSEVAAAMTVDECWALVRAVEESGRMYMLSENVCYYRDLMAVANMVRQGLFGQTTYAECGYVHDCRFLSFEADGSLTWRGKLATQFIGNWYPTHAIGPVAQWMGINKTDRFASLVAMNTPPVGRQQYAAKKFGPESPQAKMKVVNGDSTTTLIQTANGAVIDLRFDTSSNRPHRMTTYHSLQGQTASFQSLTNDIWIESRSPSYEWETMEKYLKEFDDPRWKEFAETASKSGHGGADFFVMKDFFDALKAGTPSPIDVYDAAAWSCLMPLSGQSIQSGSARVEIPDFTRGKVKLPEAKNS